MLVLQHPGRSVIYPQIAKQQSASPLALFRAKVFWSCADFFSSLLTAASSLLSSGTADENKENDLKPSLPPSYAATVARPSTSAASTVPGERLVVGAKGGGLLWGCLLPMLASQDEHSVFTSSL